MPDSALIRTELASVQLELNDPTLVRFALANLKESARIEPDSPMTWRYLATAYGRVGDQAMTMLSLSEEALALGKYGQARQQSEKAMTLLAKGSPSWQPGPTASSI